MRVPGSVQIAFAPEGASGITPSAASSGAASPSGEGSSAPSATPSSGGSETSLPPSAGTPLGSSGGADTFNFDSIFEPTESGTQSLTPAQPPVVQPTVPEVAPAAAQTQPLAVQPEVKPAPVTPPQAATATQEAPAGGLSPPLNPAEPASLAHALRTHEAAAIAQLASTEFALSPEEVEALEGDAVSAIPKLMAKAYVKAQHTMLLHLARSVPLMIQRHLEVTKRNSESADKFYSRWTNLKPDVHKDLVNRIAHSYRAANPDASLEQMIEDVGVMVSQLAKVPLPGPTLPGSGNGVRPPSTPPFVPAVGGPVVSSTMVEENPWDILGRSE